MDVQKVANLANLSLTSAEAEKFTAQFSETFKVVDQMAELNTADIEPSSQVTGLVNVMREDIIDASRTLNLNRYFVVPSVLNAK